MKEIVAKLRNQELKGNGFLVKEISQCESYFIGTDNLGSLVFLIKPKDELGGLTANSSRGKFLDIFFNMECEVTRNELTSTDSFTILSLKTVSDFFETIFLNVCENLIEFLGPSPCYQEVIKAVNTLRELFRKVLVSSSKKELGIWGELLIIESSIDKKLMIDSWHINPTDAFDFNDGEYRVEVKTTTNNERTHIVKLNQILKVKGSRALVCSIMTSEIHRGKSVKDLYSSILKKVDHNYRNKLTEKLIAAAGSSLEDFTKKYDYNSAVNSKRLYSTIDIPTINKDHLHPSINNVEYRVSLSNLKAIEDAEQLSDIAKAIIS